MIINITEINYSTDDLRRDDDLDNILEMKLEIDTLLANMKLSIQKYLDDCKLDSSNINSDWYQGIAMKKNLYSKFSQLCQLKVKKLNAIRKAENVIQENNKLYSQIHSFLGDEEFNEFKEYIKEEA